MVLMLTGAISAGGPTALVDTHEQMGFQQILYSICGANLC
jgi:hypothetical protein